MIIEIRGTGSHNKGAELMLLTIIQELRRDSRDIKFVVAPEIGSCEYALYSKLGLFPKMWLEYKGLQLGYLGGLIPKKIRQMYGLVLDKEVDVVLDASGFAYSDQWGNYSAKMMAKYTKKWKAQKKKIILMPQAFGVFERKSTKAYIKQIINNVDLIYARDKFSYRALLDVGNDTQKIRLSTDFTVLLEGKTPAYFNKDTHQICVVPNKRMIDKGRASSWYLATLIKSINYIQNNSLTPFFLIYGGKEDLSLANEINNRLKRKLLIIDEENPIFIKGIIKESLGFIGSRFHGVANALHLGIVAVGTGWGHKYKYLFDEFEFSEGLISPGISDETLFKTLNMLIDKDIREEKRKQLLMKSHLCGKQALQMFQEVKELMGIVK